MDVTSSEKKIKVKKTGNANTRENLFSTVTLVDFRTIFDNRTKVVRVYVFY